MKKTDKYCSLPLGRLHDEMISPFFMSSGSFEQDDINVQHKKAAVVQKKRTRFMGELLRSKGFLWLASTHGVMGGWQQAGNMLRLTISFRLPFPTRTVFAPSMLGRKYKLNLNLSKVLEYISEM